jgi:hypothetical protein
MDQSKEKLLSQKHTGFEELLSYLNIFSLPLSADFFFVLFTPDSETNEISLIYTFNNLRSVNHRPFLCSNPSRNE